MNTHANACAPYVLEKISIVNPIKKLNIRFATLFVLCGIVKTKII